MADWENVVEFELDNDFLLTKTSITFLQDMSFRLRKGGKTCNALADACDVVSEKLLQRAIRKMHARTPGKHRAA